MEMAQRADRCLVTLKPTSSIRPVGAGAKLVAALKDAAEKFPGDLERQAEWVRKQMLAAQKADAREQ